MSDEGVTLNIIMKDYATPVLSQLIVDWFMWLPVNEQISWLKSIGIEASRREEYIGAMNDQAQHPVVLPSATPAPAPATGSIPVMTQHVDITPTMALKGGPHVKGRPKPQPGSNLLASPTVDLTKRKGKS